ncbi:hypothetical protein CPC08DRAFT_641949 [Agrocybe pediades]|nr:hypothetical protein CPC08DRAFT_641949 [Agrocybe pediades]
MSIGDRDGRPSAAGQRTEWQGSGGQQQGAAFIPPPVIPPPGPVFAHAQQQQSGTGVQVPPPPSQADRTSSYAPYAFSPPPAQPAASYAAPVPATYAPYSYAPYAYAPYAYGPERPEPPAHNTVEMTREMLIAVLERFAEVLALPAFFGGPTGVKKLRLITHGGACMLLHPHLYGLSLNQPLTNLTLPRRTTTRDVDVLLRAFVAAVKLREAVKKTAGWYFPASTSGTVATPALGADWMNADADVALPFGVDPATNQPFDPLHVSSLTPQNISLHTVYTSPNGFLELVSVPPYWSVALKLVRWGRRDWGDVGILLR